MPEATERDPIYRGRRFSSEIIELCVRWYTTYRLSYRDLVAMMAERGIRVSHTTILRWVLTYVPEYERRWARWARPVEGSWRMDETAVSVRGGRHYLYRAVDKQGKSVESLLCSDRSMGSARDFFRKAVTRADVEWPSMINLDGYAASHRALRVLKQQDPRWQSVTVRGRRYLNNIVEQDHRAIKQRCAAMLGLKSFRTAAMTLAGIELAHRIRKRQFSISADRAGRSYSLKEQWDRALSIEVVTVCPQKPVQAPMHQNSCGHPIQHHSMPKSEFVRYARKLSWGGGLYMLMTPHGSRCWRYKYRYQGREKTLALGLYPAVPVKRARDRHLAARKLLAVGVDPALCKNELRHGTSRQQRAAHC